MRRMETVHRLRSVHTKSKGMRSPCMHPWTKTPSQNWVWVPAVPSWEKEFCKKIGLFKWDDFVEAKRLTEFTPKVLEWNDFEGKEAFDRAKRRFYAKINNLQGYDDDESDLDPDLYIDEIDWEGMHDEHIDQSDGLEFTRVESSDDEEEEDVMKLGFSVPDSYHIRIEDIKPTGWDIDVSEFSRGNVLTGLIVGS